MTRIVKKIVSIQRRKLRRSKIRIGLGPPLLFAAICLVGMLAGICINNHYYTLRNTHAAVGGEPLLTTIPPVSR